MKNLFKHNGKVIIVLAVLLTLGMAVAAAVGGGRASPLSNALGFIITPVQSGIDGVNARIAQWYGYLSQVDAYKEENRQLRIRIAEMEQTVRASEQANEENARLRKLLDLRQKRRDFDFESAGVVARDTSNWASAFTISKGETQGVAAGQSVINEEGFLVGYVSETGTNWATVTTLIDSDMECGAIIARTQFAAVGEGDFSLMQEKKLKLSYLPRDCDILIGDMVLTSGAGGKFPKDLVIGTVDQVMTEKNGISEYAVITPSVDLDAITQVYVIKSYEIDD